MKRVNIRDVATLAGVSYQTVSRVINGRPDVASCTRKRVLEIIDGLGYQPSALARSLSQNRSYTLGVVTAGLKYIGPSRTLNGITQTAEEKGYTLLLKELPEFNTNRVDIVVNSLLSRRVDGIIWHVPEIGDNRERVIDRLSDLPVPILFMTMHTQENLSIVAVDNYLGGSLAARHLLGQGYTQIGHISGPLDWWEARERKAGWEDTLARAGLPAARNQWVEGNWSSASGEKAILKLADQYPGMDAVFVANDQMALSVLKYCSMNQIRVPRDLAVVGFDNIPESAYFWPPLTTISQDLIEMGGTAVCEIIHLIELQRKEEPVLPTFTRIEPQLIVRKTTGRT